MSEHPQSKYSGTVYDLTAGEANNLDERGIPRQLGSQMRRMEIAGYDEETGTVTMAVSSSTPVERYFGLEILSHEKGAIRTERLNNGLSLLYNHNMDDLLGRSQSYELGDPLRVVNKFGPSPLAVMRQADVKAGVLKDVSLRYMVYEWEITEDKNGVRTYLAVDWEPLETSLVTIPADPTVGVGRSLDKYAAPVSVRSFRSEKDDAERKADPDDEDDGDSDDDEEDDDEERTKRSAEAPAPTPEPVSPTQPTQQRTQVTHMEEPQVIEKARIDGLRGLHKDYAANFNGEQVLEAISNGTTLDEARSLILADIRKKAPEVRSASDEVMGRMSEKETKQYSLRNAIAATINARKPNTFKDKGAEAGLEREVSDDLAKTLGQRGVSASTGNLIIPADMGRRSLQAGGNAGATTINTKTSGDVIDLLRPRCRVIALGATEITVDTGLLRLPRQTSTSQSQWLAELAGSNNSDITFDTIGFSPKRNGIKGSYTLELLAQSAVQVESRVRADQLASKARTYDAVCLIGTGGTMPLGLLNMTGLAAILTGSTRGADGTVTAGAGGKPMSFVDANYFESRISSVNGDTGTMGWMYDPQIRAAMRSTAKFPGTGGFMPMLPDSATGSDGLQEGPLGYKAGVTTNGLPTNGTVGSATNLHTVLLGVWENLVIANWGVSELVYDNITGASSGIFSIIENEFMDVNCTHIEGFAASTTVLPS